MKQSVAVTASVVIAFLLQVDLANGSEPDWEEVRRANRDSIVFLEVKETYKNGLVFTNQGTGFLIHPDGWILTCSHVVPPISSDQVVKTTYLASVGGQSEPSREFKVFKRDPDLDLALLRLKASAPDPWPVVLFDLDWKLGYDQKIYALGFPSANPYDLDGTPGSIRSQHEESWLTDAAINPGNSGGPIFASHGRVVGVAMGGVPSASQMNVVLPILYAKDWLETYGVNYSCIVDLTLHSPHAGDPEAWTGELMAQVNGVVVPAVGCPDIDRIEFDWGDGTQTEASFPAQHTYQKAGVFTVSVTAFDSAGYSDTKSVELAVAERPVIEPKESLGYEPQVKNEYFSRVGGHFNEKEEAVRTRVKLIELAELAVNANRASEFYKGWKMPTAAEVVGFSEHQVVLVRSISDGQQGKWDVGLNLVDGRGDKSQTNAQMRIVKNKISGICYQAFAVNCDQALANPRIVDEKIASLENKESDPREGNQQFVFDAQKAWLDAGLSAKECWQEIKKSSAEYYDWEKLRKMYPEIDYDGTSEPN